MNARAHFICTVAGCGAPHDAKGYCRAHYRAWRRHGDPLGRKQASPGAGWIQRGYHFVTRQGRNVPEHRIVAERALGRLLPPAAVVHHVDENRQNNAPSNLVICPDDKYHKLLHVRMDARAACGNANWRKCPYCRQYDDPARMRGEKSGRFVHRECSARAKRQARHRREMA